MAIVVEALLQLAGAVFISAGWPGSNGSTMLTNAAGAVDAVPDFVAAALAEVPELPVDPEEPQAASNPASAVRTAALAASGVRRRESFGLARLRPIGSGRPIGPRPSRYSPCS